MAVWRAGAESACWPRRARRFPDGERGSNLCPRFALERSGVLLPVTTIGHHIGDHQKMWETVIGCVAHDVRRFLASLHVLDCPLHHFPRRDNNFVGGYEMFFTAILDGALARGREGIMRLEA